MPLAKLVHLAMLMLFVMAIGGHSAAMASGEAAAHFSTPHALSVHQTDPAPGAGHPCGATDQSCCTGQCLQSGPVAVLFLFKRASRSTPVVDHMSYSNGTALPPPFRPPATSA